MLREMWRTRSFNGVCVCVFLCGGSTLLLVDTLTVREVVFDFETESAARASLDVFVEDICASCTPLKFVVHRVFGCWCIWIVIFSRAFAMW